MLKILIVSFLILFSVNASAKKFEGYVITLNGDTVKCKIMQAITVIQGVDISYFQKAVGIKDSLNKARSYEAGKIKGFGIYSDQDTLHFQSVKIKSFEMFSGFKDRWFFMNVLDDREIKLYYFVDAIATYGGGGGAHRVPKYVVQKQTDSVATWLNKTEDENNESSYRAFLKQFIPGSYSYFSDLPVEAGIKDVLDRIYAYNSEMQQKKN